MKYLKILLLIAAVGIISNLAVSKVSAQQTIVLGVKEGSELTTKCTDPITESRAPTKDNAWKSIGLDTSNHSEIESYRIKQQNGQWSDWYVAGVDDVDWQSNADGSKRRVWARFTDFAHEVVYCSEDETDITEQIVIDRSDSEQCKTILRKPTRDKYWEKLHLDTSAHQEITKYRIRWWSGEWSDWYTTGIDDLDAKTNNDGTARRMWSYFTDHVHEFEDCLTDSQEAPTTDPTPAGEPFTNYSSYWDDSIYKSPIADWGPRGPLLPGHNQGYLLLQKNVQALYRNINSEEWQKTNVVPEDPSESLDLCKEYFPGSYAALNMNNSNFIPSWYKYMGIPEGGNWIAYYCLTPPTNGYGAEPANSDLGGISYWYGKVNKHSALSTSTSTTSTIEWITDPDGVSGGQIDVVQYCQKWFPGTRSVELLGRTLGDDWWTRNFGMAYAGGMGHTFACRGSDLPTIKPLPETPVITPVKPKPIAPIKPEEPTKPIIKPLVEIKPTERLLRNSKGGVYLVDDQLKKKKPIVDQKVLEINYAEAKIEEVKNEQLDEFKEDMPVKLGDGALVKTVENPQVYVVNDGKRHWIKNEETFKELGYDFKDVQTVSQRVVKLQPVSVPVDLK